MVKSVTVAPVASASTSATTVTVPPAPRRFSLALAYEEKLGAAVQGIAMERGELFVEIGGAVRAFDAHGPVAPAPSTWHSGNPLVVVGDDAFDPVSFRKVGPKLPKSLQCESHAFSYGGQRMSASCADASGETVVEVYDTKTSARIGVFSEFRTAAPIRAGAITSSGNFVFWTARATGAFEEIKSHVTGPPMSSRSVMSRDETMVFTTADRMWLTDDDSPAKVIDPKNGRELFELGRGIDTAFFSPSSQLLAARHSKNWADPMHAGEHDVAWLTIHDRSGVELAKIPAAAGADAVEAAFAPDDSAVAARFASGAISVYDIRR